jgi:hypothetical protein
MTDYWVCDDVLIFKPYFNGELLKYSEILNKYNKLIFSNYSDPLVYIETNNEHNEKYQKNYSKYNPNKFNKSVILPFQLTHLNFGNKFNHQVNWTKSIIIFTNK